MKNPNTADDNVTKFESIKSYRKVSQWVCHDKIQSNEALLKMAGVWNTKLGTRIDVNEMAKIFVIVNRFTGIVKLRDFQYRLLHNKIFCNDILFHWKKVDSNVYNLCLLEKQSILHLLCKCCKTMPIWRWLARKLNVTIEMLSQENIILNKVKENPKHIFNTIILLCKQYIYRCKCLGKQPKVIEAEMLIRRYHKIEMFNSCKNFTTKKTINKWSPVYDAFSLSNNL